MNTQAQAQLFINFKRTLIILSAFTFDKLLLKFASVFRGMDNVVLGSVKAKWKNINDKATIIRNIFDRIETNSPSQKLYIGWIIDASIKLSFIRDNFTYPEESERDVLNDTNIFQPFNIIQSDFNSYSNDIYTNLLELIGILPDTKGTFNFF